MQKPRYKSISEVFLFFLIYNAQTNRRKKLYQSASKAPIRTALPPRRKFLRRYEAWLFQP